MKILIVGSGAREHAIALACMRSTQAPELYCCGTNNHPGLRAMCKDFWSGDITDCQAVLSQAQKWRIDLAIIGPEAPLAAGLADLLWQNGIQTVGPVQALAQIETSKDFARTLMQQHHIPGLPRYQTFVNLEGILQFLQSLGENNYVIKADGLMSGKGVKLAGEHLHSFAEALTFCDEIFAQQMKVVIEEKLHGQEFSLMCFCDGETLVPMPIVQDHKRAFENDAGPNTGGMGSYSDSDYLLPFLKDDDVAQACQINKALLAGLNKTFSEKYIGILYGSFIVTARGVYVIEFNARFGDPECLNVLSILESDFVALCQAMVSQQLNIDQVRFKKAATVCKYLVPQGYPETALKGAVISLQDNVGDHYLYLGGVDQQGETLIATGSRTLAYVCSAPTIYAAEKAVEAKISQISGPFFYRKDIGTQNLIEERVAMMQSLRTCA